MISPPQSKKNWSAAFHCPSTCPSFVSFLMNAVSTDLCFLTRSCLDVLRIHGYIYLYIYIYIHIYVYIPWFILSVSPSDSQLAILINRTVFMIYTVYQLYVVAGELSLSKTWLWQKSSGASGLIIHLCGVVTARTGDIGGGS